MEAVSEEEISRCLQSLLRHSAPYAASFSAVVRLLESQLGLDLSHKAHFIAHQLNLLNNRQQQHHTHFHLNNNHHHHNNVLDAPSPFTHLPHQHQLSFQFPQPPSPHQHQHQLPITPHVVAHGSPHVLSQPVPVSKESAPKRKGCPGGLSKVCGVSPELQVIVGEATMARTEIVKQLWAYIRKNNLQDPNNKRKIICNDELRQVFETDCTDMFRMNKLLAKHIRTLDSTKDSGSDVKRLKTTVMEEVLTHEPKPEYPVMISDALAIFFGTGEKEMFEAEVSHRVWNYIKSNQLEDPMNTMAILCDSKLQELFGCESLSALGVSQLLSRHILKRS